MACSAGVLPRHAQAVLYKHVDGRLHAVLTVEDSDTLPLLDGGHRFDGHSLERCDAIADFVR